MPKILLIDSSRERLDTTQRALQRSEYDVSVATSGSYAFTVLESGRPDLIARHADIPDTGVSELCPTIRNDPRPERDPVPPAGEPERPRRRGRGQGRGGHGRRDQPVGHRGHHRQLRPHRPGKLQTLGAA